MALHPRRARHRRAAGKGAAVVGATSLPARLTATTAQAKGLVIKGVVGHYLAGAIVLAAVLLTLGGTALALSRYVDPALAALGVGLTVLAAIVGGALYAARPKQPPTTPPH